MKLRRIQNRPEEGLHRSVAGYLDACLPPEAVWFHCPNGGARSQTEGGVLKALGVKAGIPDCLILHRGRLICIELKPKGGSLSPAQRAMKDRLIGAGAVWFLARSLDEVSAFLQVAIPDMRGRIVA